MRAWVEDLVHGVGAGQRQRHQGMAHLVIRHRLALLRVEDTVALLQAGDDALDRCSEVLQLDRTGFAPGGSQRRFVNQVG